MALESLRTELLTALRGAIDRVPLFAPASFATPEIRMVSLACLHAIAPLQAPDLAVRRAVLRCELRSQTRRRADEPPESVRCAAGVVAASGLHPSREGGRVDVTITRALVGCVDGVRLKYLIPGRTYEVWSSLAYYLFAVGAAVPRRRRAVTRRIPSKARVGVERLSSSL
jgi:hypothetical protein